MERQQAAASHILVWKAHKYNVSDIVEWHVRELDEVVSKA